MLTCKVTFPVGHVRGYVENLQIINTLGPHECKEIGKWVWKAKGNMP